MSFFKNIFGNSDESKSGVKSNVQWVELTHLDQLDGIVNQSWEKPILIFKHSTRCIISKTVLKNFEKDFVFADKVVTYFLDLLEYRPISNEIASVFNVIHQSPQLLVIKDGVSICNASHESILDVDFNQLLNGD